MRGLWVRVVLTVMIAPSLACCAMLGSLCLWLPTYGNDRAANANPMLGLPFLAAAMQAALALRCSWGRRVSTGTRSTLLLMSVGTGWLAAMLSPGYPTALIGTAACTGTTIALLLPVQAP